MYADSDGSNNNFGDNYDIDQWQRSNALRKDSKRDGHPISHLLLIMSAIRHPINVRIRGNNKGGEIKGLTPHPHPFQR